MAESIDQARNAFLLADAVRDARAAIAGYIPDYRPLHIEVRSLQTRIRDLDEQLEELDKSRSLVTREETVDEQARGAGSSTTSSGLTARKRSSKHPFRDNGNKHVRVTTI